MDRVYVSFAKFGDQYTPASQELPLLAVGARWGVPGRCRETHFPSFMPLCPKTLF